MRAAIYARVSNERQERQQTIERQLAALRAWAEGHQLSDRHVFRDEGYSGARLDRPGLDALRDAVRDGEVEVRGVLAPDRLTRRYAYQFLLLEEFRRPGCASRSSIAPSPTTPATSSCRRSRAPSPSTSARCRASGSAAASRRRPAPGSSSARTPPT